MQKFTNEEVRQMYNQVVELRNKVITELNTLTPVCGRSIAVPMPEAKERAMLRSLDNAAATLSSSLNLYYRAHNQNKDIWEENFN